MGRRSCPGTLADAEDIDEVDVTARQADANGARRLAEATAERRLHARAGDLDEIHVAARDALDDGAGSLSLTSAVGVEALVLEDVVLQVLITRLMLRDLHDPVGDRPLEGGTRTLTRFPAQWPNAAPAGFDEVGVAAGKLLRDRAGALSVGSAIVRPRFGADGKDEAEGGSSQCGGAKEPRPELLHESHASPPEFLSHDRRGPSTFIARNEHAGASRQ